MTLPPLIPALRQAAPRTWLSVVKVFVVNEIILRVFRKSTNVVPAENGCGIKLKATNTTMYQQSHHSTSLIFLVPHKAVYLRTRTHPVKPILNGTCVSSTSNTAVPLYSSWTHGVYKILSFFRFRPMVDEVLFRFHSMVR